MGVVITRAIYYLVSILGASDFGKLPNDPVIRSVIFRAVGDAVRVTRSTHTRGQLSLQLRKPGPAWHRLRSLFPFLMWPKNKWATTPQSSPSLVESSPECWATGFAGSASSCSACRELAAYSSARALSSRASCKCLQLRDGQASQRKSGRSRNSGLLLRNLN